MSPRPSGRLIAIPRNSGTGHQSPSQPNTTSIPSVSPQPGTYLTDPISIVMIPRISGRSQTGAVVPSVILRKLAAAGAGNVLSRALRALGRIERTLFTLQ